MSYHTSSIQERKSFALYINELLKGDTDLQNILPINPDNDDLYKAVSQSLLLCKMIMKIKPGSISREQLCLKSSPNQFENLQNHTIALNACKSIGIIVVNIGPQDLSNGNQHLILGLAWQLVRLELLSHVNVQQHPEISKLMHQNEDASNFVEVSPEENLLRWVNFHLAKVGSTRRMSNFGESIKDSEIYLLLLHSIAPSLCSLDPLNETNFESRAELMLQNAEKLSCRCFITPTDVIAGNPRLNLAFIANLFNKHSAIEATLAPTDLLMKQLWEAFKAKLDREEVQMRQRIDEEYKAKMGAWEIEEKERRAKLEREELLLKEKQNALAQTQQAQQQDSVATQSQQPQQPQQQDSWATQSQQPQQTRQQDSVATQPQQQQNSWETQSQQQDQSSDAKRWVDPQTQQVYIWNIQTQTWVLQQQTNAQQYPQQNNQWGSTTQTDQSASYPNWGTQSNQWTQQQPQNQQQNSWATQSQPWPQQVRETNTWPQQAPQSQQWPQPQQLQLNQWSTPSAQNWTGVPQQQPNWGSQTGWNPDQWQLQSSQYNSYVDPRQIAFASMNPVMGAQPGPAMGMASMVAPANTYVQYNTSTVFGGTQFYQHVRNRLIRDYIIILDKSGSMAGSLWRQAKAAVSKLAQFACQADPDGITLYLFSSPTNQHPRYPNIRDARMVEQIFNRESPSGSTDLTGVLRQAFLEHFQKGGHPPTTILVVTDGSPDNQHTTKAEIIQAANRIRSDEELSVTFVQIGRCAEASRFLKKLDDNLNARFDIVDRVTTDEMNGMTFEELINKSIDD